MANSRHFQKSFFNLDLPSLLNPAQLAAATYQGGPLLIVAGAGSGKTRTLVHRVAYLVEQGIPPPSILLLTFTRKAAQEMLTRATALVGPKASKVAGGTFHSLANYLLRAQAHLLGYTPDFSIMDQDDAEALIGRIRKEIPEIKKYTRFPAKSSILNILSQSINKDRPLLEIIAENFPLFLDYAPLIATIGEKYKEYKLQSSLMDYDDLLVGLETVLRDNPEVRLELASRYEYILVDEYQDTNPIQARLTHLLGQDHQQVTAVGDDAQSIYAFRGASFRNIMDFPNIFPGTKILKLEENYRSYQPIVTLANQLIFQAQEKYDKTLVAIRSSGGESPKLVAVHDLEDEAGWVATHIEKLLETAELKDIAVLFRASTHSFDLEVELVRRRIPYTKYGGRKFLESAHIKDFMAFLRVAANPGDGVSLRRILSLVEGVGPKSCEDIANWAKGSRELLAQLNAAPAKGMARKNLGPLAELLASIIPEKTDMAFRVQAVYDYYYPKLEDLYTEDWADRQPDLKDIQRMTADRHDLRNFLDELTLDPPNQQKVGTTRSENTLTLSTIHSAKGLEWKNVILLSAVEGRFPPSYAVRSAANVEEERRLMYVAVTRAEDVLYIMLPLGLMDRRTGMYGQPNRFLTALPPSAGITMWRGNQQIEPNEVLNSGKDLRYNSQADPFYCPSTWPQTDSGPTPVGSLSQPDPVDPATIAKGQRISHPLYGPGLVLKIKESQAEIDFDLFGTKKIMLQYAKLTLR